MNWQFLKPKVTAPQAPNLFREMELGAQANALLESPAYQRAVLKMREGIHIAWAKSPVADAEGQHKLRLMLKLLDDMEANLKEESDTGKMAARQVDEEAKRKSRIAA